MNVQRAAAAVSLSLVAAIGAGCESKGFIDPSEMGRYEKTPLVVPILDKLVVGVEGDDVQFSGARDVTDADLAANSVDYKVGANDLINVTINELAGAGLSQVEQKRVSESGNISLPFLKQVHVAGQSESEVERTISKAYEDAQIFPVGKAVIGVTVVESQNRIYGVSGAVTQGGTFPLLRSNMRLLEAINNARGVTSELGIDNVYVIRQKSSGSGAGMDNGGGTMTSPTTNPTTPGTPDPLAPQSRAKPIVESQPIFARAVTEQPAPTSREDAIRQARELSDQLRNNADNGQPAVTPSATPAVAPAAAPVTPPTNTATNTGASGHVIQIEGAGTQPAMPDAAPTITTLPPGGMNDPTMTGSPAAASDASKPFAFTAPSEPTDQEVIRVPYAKLKTGELKYNVVIQPGDMIVVPSPPIGEYYMGGHVARPGVYSLSAREITLMQAVISAGMLDQLAIPARTDVIRRLGRGKQVFVRVDLERIFAGLEPDVYLKPDDQVMVGTNIGATFLAAARNAFRITYGFGFLYDRNYAPAQNQNNQ